MNYVQMVSCTSAIGGYSQQMIMGVDYIKVKRSFRYRGFCNQKYFQTIFISSLSLWWFA